MRRFAIMTVVACIVGLLMIAAGCSDREGTLSPAGLEQLAESKINPNPGPDPEALPMNLSFPIIFTCTDSASLALLDQYIQKTESITKVYTGSYPGMTEEEVAYLRANAPWYPQPPYANENTWVADYVISEDMHDIVFVDWGNPMENIDPRVGQRFPVEVALYERIGLLDTTTGIFTGTTMEAYRMACLEYNSTRDELFGTNKAKYNSCFATVLTTQFTVTVRPPDTWQEYEIRLDPAVGPSGKMNFASANGGWIPEVPGWHRITLTINDPNINLVNADVENDEHFDMTTGIQLEELSWHKKELSGVFYNTTYIDVYVLPKGGK
jgi:hypothetical protein